MRLCIIHLKAISQGVPNLGNENEVYTFDIASTSLNGQCISQLLLFASMVPEIDPTEYCFMASHSLYNGRQYRNAIYEYTIWIIDGPFPDITLATHPTVSQINIHWLLLRFVLVWYTQLAVVHMFNMSIFPRGPLYQHGLTSILAWISNYTHCNMWESIIHPSPNFNGEAVEVW